MTPKKNWPTPAQQKSIATPHVLDHSNTSVAAVFAPPWEGQRWAESRGCWRRIAFHLTVSESRFTEASDVIKHGNWESASMGKWSINGVFSSTLFDYGSKSLQQSSNPICPHPPWHLFTKAPSAIPPNNSGNETWQWKHSPFSSIIFPALNSKPPFLGGDRSSGLSLLSRSERKLLAHQPRTAAPGRSNLLEVGGCQLHSMPPGERPGPIRFGRFEVKSPCPGTWDIIPYQIS